MRMFSCAASWRKRSSRALECSGPFPSYPCGSSSVRRDVSPHLERPADDELVDDDLRAVHEVAELRLPQHERLRRGHRVAVLEADARVLGERRVVDLERRRPPRRDAASACTSRRCSTSWRTAWRCEKVPRSVSWPVRRIGMPSTSSDANASASAWPQSIPPSSSASRRRSSCFSSFGCTREPVGHAQQLLVELAQPRGGDGRVTIVLVARAGMRCSTGVVAGSDAERRLQLLVRGASARDCTSAMSSSALARRDHALLDEPRRRTARARSDASRSPRPASGCVYAASSCSLCPCGGSRRGRRRRRGRIAAVREREPDRGDRRLGVVGVDVDDRDVEALRQVARVARRAAVLRDRS